MQVSFIDTLDQIDRDQWNAVTGIDYPFTRFEFLHALQVSGATNGNTGWQSHHLLVHDATGQQLLAVMPLYLKFHSYGEYVFDWSWADAYQRAGLDYYPKLLAAIPYTPATGPRLCIKPGQDNTAITACVIDALKSEARRQRASSIHILFPDSNLSGELQALGLDRRRAVQYHWFNEGYRTFDEFLCRFSSRKRKNLNKERHKVNAQGLRLQVLCGTDIPRSLWQRFYYFYQLTYAKRSGHGGYLEQRFFELIADTMPEQLVLVLAYDDNRDTQPIAGALNFRDSHTLYGRYWGCLAEYDFLHFETCYYQGIDYCIAEGLKRFDPGAQGEHKIQRGFIPTETWSNHWIAHPEFRAAIADFLHRDNDAMLDYRHRACELLPFKRE